MGISVLWVAGCVIGKLRHAEIHGQVAVEHLPDFGRVVGAGGLVERDADGVIVNHAEVHPMRLGDLDDVGGTLFPEANPQRVEIRC